MRGMQTACQRHFNFTTQGTPSRASGALESHLQPGVSPRARECALHAQVRTLPAAIVLPTTSPHLRYGVYGGGKKGLHGWRTRVSKASPSARTTTGEYQDTHRQTKPTDNSLQDIQRLPIPSSSATASLELSAHSKERQRKRQNPKKTFKSRHISTGPVVSLYT